MTPRLCLNMLVRDDAATIERSLASIVPHVSCCVIADAGSTDGSADIAKRVLEAAKVPFEIVKVPFENFGQARNAALDACRASRMDFDFILLADADMELHVDAATPVGRQLEYPAHQILQRVAGGLEFAHVRIIRRDLPGKYVGVSHEVLDVGYRGRHALKGVHFIQHAGARDMSAKHQKDVELFTEEVKKRPDDTRSSFYLANALYALGRHEEAIRWYRRRIELGGWQEEVFYSHYRIARCMLALDREADFFHQCLLAFDAFPDRAEPLHLLAVRCMETKLYRVGYHVASIAAGVPRPSTNALFVEPSVYDWRIADVTAVCAYYIDRKREALSLNEKIFDIVPVDQKQRILANITACRA